MVVGKSEGEGTVDTYDKVVGEKRAIGVADIFSEIDEQHPAVGKILLLGAAGVGKTTLLHYMSYYWGKGGWDKNDHKVFDDKFEYLFRVRLKTLLNKEWSNSYPPEAKDKNLLACLIHHCLTLQISDLESTKKINKGESKITLEKVENSLRAKENNSKILLLLDGYDEMSSLENNYERRKEYRDIIDSIFNYQNVVMTSRPNAINDEMQARFERQIVNEGLDLAGVKQYVELNFREDDQKLGKTLENFLSTNSNILDMCKIPINTALLCLIWHDQQVRGKLTSEMEGDQCNTGLLYKEVILWLGKRYSKKFDKNFEEKALTAYSNDAMLSGTTLLSGTILDILKTVAYTGFNDGKLAIAGQIISNEAEKKGKSIQDITKYGLLKAEGDVEQPIKQNYYFIHLTFQEYLTACYLKDHLASSDQKTVSEAASLIANHRNDSKYLMTLKFLSGLVISEQGENSQELVTRFWEAVICNIDGVIELGGETKINLLIHLLGQAKVKGEIDSRIPNREQILQLIDKVILKNLLAWGNQLKDSNYINDNIKQGLLKGLENNVVTGRYIEIVSDLINKFSVAEQDTIITRLQHIIIEEIAVEGKKDWQLIKQTINGITKIATQVNLPNENAEILVEPLMSKIIDYREVVVKPIAELLNNINDQELSINIIDLIESIKDQQLINSLVYKVNKNLIDYFNIWLDIAPLHDTRMIDTIMFWIKGLGYNQIIVRNFLDQFDKIIEHKDNLIQHYGLPFFIELIFNLDNQTKTTSEDQERVKNLINKLFELYDILHDDFARIDQMWIDFGISSLFNKFTDIAMNHFNELINDKGKFSVIWKVCNVMRYQSNKTIVRTILDKVSNFSKHTNTDIREEAVSGGIKLLNSLKDPDITKSFIDTLILHWRYKSDYVRQNAKEIVELIKNLEDTEITRSFINELSKLLADKDMMVNSAAVEGTVELVKSLENPEITKSFINKLIPLLESQDFQLKMTAIDGITTLVKNLKDNTLTSSVINKLIPLLTYRDNYVREMAIKTIAILVVSQEEPKMTKSFVNKLIPLLKDLNSQIKMVAIGGIVTLVKSLEDLEFTKSFFDTLSTFLAKKPYAVTGGVLNETIELVKSLEDTEITKNFVGLVSKFLTSDDTTVQKEAKEVIRKITANLLIPKEEFIRYLNHPSKEIRDGLVDDLGKSFKDFLEKIQLLEKLTKSKQELQFKIIKEKLFDNNVDQTLQDQIKNLHDLVNNNDQVTQEENLTTLKDIILSGINKIGNVKSHELIEIALLVIGNYDISADDTHKKELVQSAKEVINRQIEYLSNEGLKWVNDHFKDLVSASKDSKLFVRKLYHKILTDIVSTKDADFVVLKELIIKFINCGMTTSLTKTGEIIFEGKKYTLKGDNKDVILEEITRAVINQDSDILAKQYRENNPLFPRTGKELEQAAADVKPKSILGDQVEILHKTWRLSLVHFSDHKKTIPTKVFLLLESRSAFGDLMIYKIPSTSSKQLERLHPSHVDSEFCQNIFGKMEYHPTKPRCYVTSFDIDYVQAQALLTKINKVGTIEDSSNITDATVIRQSLIALLKEIVGDDLCKSVPETWEAYKDLNTTKELKKVQILHLEDQGTVELTRQASLQIDTAEKLQSIENALHLFESVKAKFMQIQSDQTSVSDEQLKLLWIKIASLEKYVHDSKISTSHSKVSDQDPIINEITETLTDILEQKDIDRNVFMSIEERLQSIEEKLQIVYRVDDVVYDNPLLNNLALLKDAGQLFGLNQALDLSNKLSQELITEAITNNNPTVILGGLLSLADGNENI